MEIKNTLQKPYTEEQRVDFIVNQNHRLGYEIRETEIALEAWGKDSSELLEEKRQAKYSENEQTRDKFLLSGVIYKDILFDSDIEQKLNISVTVNQMSDTDVINWVGMDGVTYLECTKTDLLAIGELLTNMTSYVWSVKNPEIKIAIQNAQTIEELDNIEIIYSLDDVINQEPEPEIIDEEKENDIIEENEETQDEGDLS